MRSLLFLSSSICIVDIIQSQDVEDVSIAQRDYIAIVSAEGMDFATADELCQSTYGTRLASIETDLEAEQALLRRAESSDPDGLFWIGLADRDFPRDTSDKREGRWRFLGRGRTICPNSDCSQLAYWRDNAPSTKAAGDSSSNFQDCGVIKYDATQDMDYKMIEDVLCGKTEIAGKVINALCNSPFIALTPDTVLGRTKANKKCGDYFGTELATIQYTVDAQSALAVVDQSDAPEENFWVGLHDTGLPRFEGYWRNEEDGLDCDGNCDELPFWGYNEPNDWGSGEDCAHIRYERHRTDIYDMLNDIECDSLLVEGILCNAPDDTVDRSVVAARDKVRHHHKPRHSLFDAVSDKLHFNGHDVVLTPRDLLDVGLVLLNIISVAMACICVASKNRRNNQQQQLNYTKDME